MSICSSSSDSDSPSVERIADQTHEHLQSLETALRVQEDEVAHQQQAVVLVCVVRARAFDN